MPDTTSATATASDLQMQFMTLLVTQLKNQNPMEPMDGQDMAGQLAQFTELEQLEQMNSSFGSALEVAKREYASSLVGKDVSFNVEAADGTEESNSGAVEEVVMAKGNGEIELLVGDYTIGLADVLSVRDGE